MARRLLLGILVAITATSAGAQEKTADQNIAIQTVPGIGKAEVRILKYKDAIGVVHPRGRPSDQLQRYLLLLDRHSRQRVGMWQQYPLVPT